jgi:hypothetical protein
MKINKKMKKLYNHTQFQIEVYSLRILNKEMLKYFNFLGRKLENNMGFLKNLYKKN